MKDIYFYLIHNNDIERIFLRNRIIKLSKSLKVGIKEIYKQKSNLNIKFNFISKYEIIFINYLRIYLNLKHKKEISLEFLKFIFVNFLKFSKIFLRTIFQNKQDLINELSHIRLEQIVARKHIRAWGNFLNSKKEIIIVFEDDVICNKDSEERLKILFHEIKYYNFDYLFVDLAGGYEYKKIIPKNKIKKIEDEKIFIQGLFTNTACGYLMNRSLVEKLYKEYKSFNSNKILPIDHLINKLNLKSNNGKLTLCVHFKKPIFTHGSFTGNIKSWQIK